MTPLDEVRTVLETAYGAELAEAICDAYAEIERSYAVGHWKASELDAGHFVEAVRRALEFETTGSYTPLRSSIPNFSNSVLSALEQATSCDDSVRFHIPRLLYAVYGIRNKRGVAHLGPVSANEMDSTLILYVVKWVVAELVRLKSTLDPSETQALVDAVVEREISLLWKTDEFVTVLDPGLDIEAQILVLLYDGDKTTSDLYRSMPDKDRRNIRRTLERMAADKKLAYNTRGEACFLSPVGRVLAERVIAEHEFEL